MTAQANSNELSNALTEKTRHDYQRAYRAARKVGLFAPMALLTAGFVLLVAWLPRMPDPAATHWGTAGPDGFGEPVLYLFLYLCVGYGLALLLWAFIALSSRPSISSPRLAAPVWGLNQRFLAAFTMGFSAFIAATLLGGMAVQLDLTDARTAGEVGLPVAVGLALWPVLGLLGWFLQPKITIAAPSEGQSAPLELTQTGRAAWFGEVRPSRVFYWAIGGTLLLLLSVVFALIATGAPGFAVVVVACCTLLIAAALLCCTWFRVRVDATGLEARSILGWPVFRVSAGDVQSVEVAFIEPFAEFGGWGMRWTPTGFGLVLRRGEGLLIRRSNGRVFAVTTDAPEDAAAVLAAAAEGARRTSAADNLAE